MIENFLIDVDGQLITITQSQDELFLDGQNIHASLVKLRPKVYSLLLNGRSHLIHSADEEGNSLTINGKTVTSRIVSERSQLILRYGEEAKEQNTTCELRAPMPGLIMRILVQPGDQVDEDQGACGS